MYKYIFNLWSHGDIHKLDIEFGRPFAKLVSIMQERPPSTKELIQLHEALCKASRVTHQTGFVKEDNYNWSADHHFIGGQQLEFYKLKPLLRALIIVINKRIDEAHYDDTNPYLRNRILKCRKCAWCGQELLRACTKKSHSIA
jgi:hypothetical protein